MRRETRQGNTLDTTEVQRALAESGLAATVQHFPEVESTNDLALAAARAGHQGGIWVADAQTAGRGRGGHSWHSAAGDGLYLSLLLTPADKAAKLVPSRLSLAAGLAAWEAIREVTGITVDVRWPNDLVTRPEFGEGSRKLGGVLVEAASTHAAGPASLRYAVVGIGINVAHRQFPPELERLASSLFLEGWQAPDRQPLLIALLRRFGAILKDEEVAETDASRAHSLEARLTEASTWLQGKRVTVPEQGGYTGVTAGLDQSGYLQVDGDDGVRRTVHSGGVREG